LKKKTPSGLPAILALFAAFAVLVSACYNEFPLYDATKVYLDPSEVVLQVGETATLIATLRPHATMRLSGINVLNYSIVDWSYGDEDIVSLTSMPGNIFDSDWTARATITAEDVGEVYITIEVREIIDYENDIYRTVPAHSVRVVVYIPGEECECPGCDCDEANCAEGDCVDCECAHCVDVSYSCDAALCDCYDSDCAGCDCANSYECNCADDDSVISRTCCT